VELGFAVEITPSGAPLRTGNGDLRIDVDALHQGQADHQAALGGRTSRHIVTATADGDLEPLIALDGPRTRMK
jgi:hypothetical protein